MTITYSQRTGELTSNGVLLALGYSGFAFSKNNPDAQNKPYTGPIPRGDWQIEKPPTTEKGPLTFRLTPLPGTDTEGRSGFLIHGDSRQNPGCASEGCIILPLHARELLADNHITTITVTR